MPDPPPTTDEELFRRMLSRLPQPAQPHWRPTDAADHARLPQLDSSRITLLWEMRRFDGPLNGLALYEGRKVWFDIHHMDEEGTHYFYTLYPLTDAQAAEADLWHQTRGRYQHPRWVGRDEARHDATYGGPSFAGVEPLGWFKDGHNPAFYGIQVTPAPPAPPAPPGPTPATD